MTEGQPSHSDKGFLKILSKPWIYELFQKLIAKKNERERLVRNYIKPFPGCRILDIGCGTGNILTDLPDSIGEYTGFDMNSSYIEAAKKKWEGRSNCNFFCKKVKDKTISDKNSYDIIIAMGIVHHLSDSEAGDLFKLADHALKVNGCLLTYDNVYIDNQHWFAKWFISKDRGKAVRTVDGYKQLAKLHFEEIEEYVLHDTLRVPYTIFIMRCIKGNLIATTDS